MADTVLDPVTADTAPAWTFLSDRVMGGVSQGVSAYAQDGDTGYLRLSGEVSTENRGGFIQMRREISLPANAHGLVLRVRGNGQRYYVHLRTSGIKMPWQFYQAPFDTTDNWQEVRIPFSAFRPSGGFQRADLRPGTVRSIGIAAYGRDHRAEVALAEIGAY